MAVDDIGNTNPALATVPLNQGRSITKASTSLGALLTTPPPTVAPTEDIATAQQTSALRVSEALNQLNFVAPTPNDALLIDKIQPATALLLENTELTPAQQTAVAITETLTALAAEPGAPTTPLAATAAQEAAPATAATTGTATTTATQATTVAATTAAAVQTTPTTTPTETVPTAAQPAIVQPVQDRNIIATPVYEIRDQKPPEPELKPRRKEVFPPIPIGRARPVDPLVLRQEWERRRKNMREEENAPSQPLAERAIREMIGRTNDDLAANGLPLRLVLAKNAEGYSVDVYDCSYDQECRLSQEVHLDLNQLVTILENLQQETGIIINIMT